MPKCLFDSSEIDVRCPNCGHKNPKTIAWLRGESAFTCAGCGANVIIEAETFRREIEAADKSMKGFQRKLRDLFGKMS